MFAPSNLIHTSKTGQSRFNQSQQLIAKVELWLGSSISCYINYLFYQTELFLDYKTRLALTYYFDYVTCDMSRDRVFLVS